MEVFNDITAMYKTYENQYDKKNSSKFSWVLVDLKD